MGRKVWTRETLSAADLQDYLQDQAVLSFPSAAVRLEEWPAPPRGAVSHLFDVDRHDVYVGGVGWSPLAGGARGNIARVAPAGTVGSTGGGVLDLGVTAAAAVRSGERLRHTVSLGLWAPAQQSVTLTVARYDAATTRTVVGAVDVPCGGGNGPVGPRVSFHLEETPAAGAYYWRLQAQSNVTTNMAYVSLGAALFSTDVVART